MSPCRWTLVLLSTLAATSAHAEIFKCIGKGTLPVYQNFRCQLDSADADALHGSGVDPQKVVKRDVRAAGNASVATSPASFPRVGMTANEVRAIWGKPGEVTTEENAEADVEVWKYTNSRSVRFDRKHHVIAIHP